MHRKRTVPGVEWPSGPCARLTDQADGSRCCAGRYDDASDLATLSAHRSPGTPNHSLDRPELPACSTWNSRAVARPFAGCQTNQTGYPGGLPVPMAHAHHGGVFRRCQRSASPIWPFPVPRGTSPQRTWPWSTAVRQTRARQSYDGGPPMSAATRPLEIPSTTAIMPVARRSFPTAVARCYLSTSRAPHAGERRSLAGRSGWAGRRPAVRASQDVGQGWPGDGHAADPGRTGRPWNASPHRGALVRMP